MANFRKLKQTLANPIEFAKVCHSLLQQTLAKSPSICHSLLRKQEADLVEVNRKLVAEEELAKLNASLTSQTFEKSISLLTSSILLSGLQSSLKVGGMANFGKLWKTC